MVYIFDEGSVFDAPIDRIWQYLPSDKHQHASTKVLSREVTGNEVVISAERKIEGRFVKAKFKNTLYPPFGFVQEYLEGPMAGSKAFVFYVPKGDKTGISVVGDFRFEGADEKRTKEAVLAQLQTSFDEDNTNLKKT